MLRRPVQPPAEPSTRPLRVLIANVQYSNRRIGDVIAMIVARDVDVIAVIEYTAGHAAAFRSSQLAASHPHRIESQDRGPGGAAVWSRFPLAEVPAPRAVFPTIAAVVAAPAPVIVFAVHPPNPLKDLSAWHVEHERLADLHSTVTEPATMIGDFNSGYWHRAFRGLLDAGWRDAHQLLGRALTTSWPTDRFAVPPFVRLDHALVNRGLVAVDVDGFAIPGSDHRGFVVSVAPAARAGRSR